MKVLLDSFFFPPHSPFQSILAKTSEVSHNNHGRAYKTIFLTLSLSSKRTLTLPISFLFLMPFLLLRTPCPFISAYPIPSHISLPRQNQISAGIFAKQTYTFFLHSQITSCLGPSMYSFISYCLITLLKLLSIFLEYIFESLTLFMTRLCFLDCCLSILFLPYRILVTENIQ